MVALATEAMVFSVAGSMTSKRALSDDLRHLPPIHRSVGTLARRFSYMTHILYLVIPGAPQVQTRNPETRTVFTAGFRARGLRPRPERRLTSQRPLHPLDNPLRRR